MEAECAKALLDYMKNNKSTGSDGLTAEFYELFWRDVNTYYLASILAYMVLSRNFRNKES